MLKATVDNETTSKTDSVGNQKCLKILKINPFQTFFSEIPISFEVFSQTEKQYSISIWIYLPQKKQYFE